MMNYKKGSLYGFILGDILGNATNNMTKEEIYDTYYSFGFGLDKTFTFKNIVVDTKRTIYYPGDWSHITDNMIIALESANDDGKIDINRLNEDYIYWYIVHLLPHPHEKILDIIANISHLLVSGLLINNKETIVQYILHMCETTAYDTEYVNTMIFCSLLINSIINFDKSQNMNIDELINEIFTYINNKKIINILEKYINYNNYADVDDHKNNILKLLSFSIITLKKLVMNSENSQDIFMDTIMEVAREGGNAHINCALVGMICGSYIGYDKLPHNMLMSIQYKNKLDNLINVFINKL